MRIAIVCVRFWTSAPNTTTILPVESRRRTRDSRRSLPRIAAVCGVAQLAVVLVFLSPNQSPPGTWQGFLFVSAFAQWLALAAAVSLCKSRALLSRFRPVLGYSLAALIPALITAIAAWLGQERPAPIQLLALFALWTPTGIVWWRAEGAAFWGLSCAYALSWLILLKASFDAGAEVQSGALGWMSLLARIRPVFPDMPTQGLFRVIRQPIYVALYAAAIIFFCFFYTALVFNSRETADNLKKSGAFIPGIRPGDQTARYIDKILLRLTLAGAVYITLVCLLPEFLILQYQVPFYFGGTSLLIIVVVTMDFMAQVQNYMMSQQYESLLKKANFKAAPGA